MISSTPAISFVTGLQDVPPDCVLVIPVFEDDDLGDMPTIPGLSASRVTAAVHTKAIRTSRYECFLALTGSEEHDVLMIGGGKRADLTGLLARRIFAAAARFLVSHGYESVAVLNRFGFAPAEFGQVAADGMIDGPLDPGVKKSRKDPLGQIFHLCLVSEGDQTDLQDGSRIGAVVATSRALARNLVNAPPNELTPTRFADIAEEVSAQNNINCAVLDESHMADLGMGGILGISAGSAEPARVICLKIGDDNAEVRLAFVGKGLTFDSGGLSIKTAQGMETMKSDMGGGAAVLAGMVALARLNISGISVRGYIGATENMTGPGAMRPGDVLTALNGVTIEVLNTDAEGRIVLADVLAYAVQEGATHLVDFATLTGGAVVALGSAASLAAGRPDEWVAQVIAAAQFGSERAWAMPLYPEYRQEMDSNVADIKNVGGRSASALTAAAFLSDFVGDVPWAHMDIAGTAFAEVGSAWRASGGTGEGVGTIVALATEMARNGGTGKQ